MAIKPKTSFYAKRVVSTILFLIIFDSFWYCGDCCTRELSFSFLRQSCSKKFLWRLNITSTWKDKRKYLFSWTYFVFVSNTFSWSKMTFTWFPTSFTFSMLVRSACTDPPARAHKLALAGTPPSLATLLYKFTTPRLNFYVMPLLQSLVPWACNQGILTKARKRTAYPMNGVTFHLR